MSGKWTQRTLINDQELAKKLKDVDGPLFTVKIVRDEAALTKATSDSSSKVYAIMELSVDEKFTNDIVGNFLKDVTKHLIYETLGIKPEKSADSFVIEG